MRASHTASIIAADAVAAGTSDARYARHRISMASSAYRRNDTTTNTGYTVTHPIATPAVPQRVPK
jgi:hypothetical protein